MNREEAPARAADTVTLDLDGGTLVYQRRTGEVHRLDAVGSIVWRVLDGRTSVDELVNDLAAAFGVDSSVVQTDVDHLLNTLGQASLLEGGPVPETRREPVLLINPPSP